MKCKRQSPSHPSEKQFLQRVGLYHASNFPFFWKVKAGIGFKPEKRLKNVSGTTAGYVWPTATIEKMEFGKWCESWIHFLYAFQNAPFRRGSGRSEWFINLNPIVGGLFTWWAFSTGRLFVFDWWYYALVWCFPFLWLDYLLWMVVFRVLRILFWVAVGFAIIVLLKSYI